MIKGRENEMSGANNERCQVLNPHSICGGSIDGLEVLKIMLKVIMDIGTGYLFDTEFHTSCLERGTDYYVVFLDEVPSASQIKKYAHALSTF
jgi:hypothetical protein